MSSSTHFRCRNWLTLLTSVGGLATVVACSSDTSSGGPTITVGLLLPYTGYQAATTVNFEQAVLYAADRINSTGGIQGYSVRVVAADTHSDPLMAKQSAITLIDKGATVVIGPESAEIAPEILPVLREHNVALISPVVGASADSTVDCSEPWFRLAPSAQVLGRSLGKLVLQHGAKKIVILASTAAYDHALSVAAGQEFGKGGFVLATEIVDNQAQTYASIIANTLSANPDAIVVAATPEAAALIVNEYSTTVSKHAQWYFSPLLKTDLFIQNVDPNAIEGALGVAPEVWDTGSDFVDAYSAQWAGVAPLEGADYFYDAVSILGLALLKSNIGANGQVSFASFNQSFFGAAGPPGTWVSWNDIEEGMNKSRNGESVYYSGLTGPIVLDSCGARQIGSAGIWTVKNGSIVAAE